MQVGDCDYGVCGDCDYCVCGDCNAIDLVTPKLQRRGLVSKCKLVTVVIVCVVNVVL